MIKKVILISLLIIVMSSAKSQTIWTLDDCIRHAIKENLQLKQVSTDNAVRKEEFLQSRMDMLPSLNGWMNLGNNYGRSVDPTTNGIISTQVSQADMHVGTSFTLFQGFLNINKVMFCRMNINKGFMTEEALKNDIAFKVMHAYYDLCFNRGLSLIAINQRELSAMNLKKIQIMVETGIRAQPDIAEMEARLALDEYKLTQAQNNENLSLLALKQLLNLRGDQAFDIDHLSLGIATPDPGRLNPDSVYNLATQQLPQFRAMELDAKLSHLNLSMARGKRLPSIQADAGYRTGYYNSYKDSDNRILSLNSQMKNNASQYVGLSLILPVFNGWKVNREISTAKLNMEKTNVNNEILKRELYAEIENACYSLKAAADEYYSAQKQEQASSLTLQLTEKKWEHGTGNLLELADARNRLASASAEKLRTHLQYELKLKTIGIFTGNLKI